MSSHLFIYWGGGDRFREEGMLKTSTNLPNFKQNTVSNGEFVFIYNIVFLGKKYLLFILQLQSFQLRYCSQIFSFFPTTKVISYFILFWNFTHLNFLSLSILFFLLSLQNIILFYSFLSSFLFFFFICTFLCSHLSY